MSTLNRKRSRSDDNSLSMQNKIFVDQKFLNEQNEEKMKQIHGKHVSLIYVVHCIVQFAHFFLHLQLKWF